jgi:hypothetical protein
MELHDKPAAPVADIVRNVLSGSPACQHTEIRGPTIPASINLSIVEAITCSDIAAFFDLSGR